MEIIGNKLDDKLATKILQDTSDMKLIIARKYLNEINNPAQWSFNRKYFLTQYYAESFFHYAYSVIEIIQHDIEENLRFIPLVKSRLCFVYGNGTEKSTFQDEKYPEYYIKDFIKKLKNSKNKKANKLYPIFIKYFSPPRKINNKWDFSKSKLWMLREIRNHVAHQPILSHHANIVVGGGSSAIWFAFRFKLVKSKRTKKEFEIAVLHNRPRDFFEDLFTNLIKFRYEVRKIIPKKNPSFRYKNPPNFGQRF